jgi:hypothetical protein
MCRDRRARSLLRTYAYTGVDSPDGLLDLRERVQFIKKISPRAPTRTSNTEAG